MTCSCVLSLRASLDGTSLVVRKFIDEHNHPISRVSSYIETNIIDIV